MPQTSKSGVSVLTIVFLLLSLLLTYTIVLKGLEYNKQLFTWSSIALFLGLLLESYLIVNKLSSILNCFTVSFFVSLFTFLPGKRERVYNLQNHIQIWPYFFLISFIIGIIILKQKEITSKQTEGTTLLQSIGLLYWLFDYGFFENISITKAVILFIAISATLFSLSNALTKINLSKSNRLYLSVWSSFVLMCLAIDNIYKVFSNGDIDQQPNLATSIHIAIQYFFVGMSSVYVVQNIYMLIAFLPEKNTEYKKTLYTAKKMHLDRFSEHQVSTKDSILCICYCILFFTLNSIYDFMPRHTMIWFVLLTFPIFLHLQKWIRQEKFS